MYNGPLEKGTKYLHEEYTIKLRVSGFENRMESLHEKKLQEISLY